MNKLQIILTGSAGATLTDVVAHTDYTELAKVLLQIAILVVTLIKLLKPNTTDNGK